MDRNEAASIIKRYLTCTDIMHNCNGKCTLCRYYPSDEEKESALKLAIEALEQSPTALDHIHNVVRDDAYRRGYEQGKADAPGEAHWIKKYTPDDGEVYECDNCGVTWQFNDGGPEENEAFYCPKCGFKMERGEEE